MELFSRDSDRFRAPFILVTTILVVIGAIMVYSSSYIYAQETYGNSAHYFTRQLIYLGIALVGAFIVSKTKFRFWLKYGHVFNWMVTALILMTFIPGLALEIKGAHRWISMGAFSFQPGELLKYTIGLAAIGFFQKFETPIKQIPRKELGWGIANLLIPLGLVVVQPDFGTFTICMVIIGFVCFLSPFPRILFWATGASAIAVAVPILLAQPYRVQRLFTYLDPWKNAQGSGFQIIQSYLAFANGSIFGLGLGNSNEKLFYLPEAHNDFIFSVLGEELGFVGVCLVIILFMAMMYLGFRMALQQKEEKAVLLSSTIIFIISLQIVLNMGVVLGLLPTKGLNLPLISYGGSSMLSNFFGLGLFFSVLNTAAKETPEPVYDAYEPNRESSPFSRPSFSDTTTQGSLF
tara:strand:+ start:1488 stop:2702 length:1215 start_codon:yes stop_codon:yes gene_type:complete